ncbi:hypothetical protein GCM10008083_14280 [Ulvibacter litoralis]|nr:hypothetical protein GCM10008083_14280 [Ulvibacter litoralis]
MSVKTEKLIKTSTKREKDSIEKAESIRAIKEYNKNKETKISGLKGVTVDGDIIFMYSENVSILENSSEIFIPAAIIEFKYKTKKYLQEHPDTEVHINSLYSASENFESPNLGIKRGEKIKEVLLSVGIPNENIVVKPIIKALEFNEEGFFDNSISILFKPLDQNRVEELKTRLPDTKTVYPTFSNSGILINDNLKELLAEVKQVVQDNPDVRIELIGHTDNIGNEIDNYKMGLDYAKQVEWYLIAKGGIRNSKIKSSSKGESEPIEANNTEAGRTMNRRVVVVYY